MQKGFTLAEVLITLGIIGVVAAITIPGLISRYEEKTTVSRVLKTYATLDNAYKSLLDEYGSPVTWEGISTDKRSNSLVVANLFATNIKLTNICHTTIKGCSENIKYDALTRGALLEAYKTIHGAKSYLNESTVYFDHISENCQGWSQYAWDSVTQSSQYYHSCGMISVDINGRSLPNKYGRDLFQFIYTEDKLVPVGTPPTPYYSLASSCNPTVKSSLDGATNGSFCTAWIIKKKNMDYLKHTVTW